MSSRCIDVRKTSLWHCEPPGKFLCGVTKQVLFAIVTQAAKRGNGKLLFSCVCSELQTLMTNLMLSDSICLSFDGALSILQKESLAKK